MVIVRVEGFERNLRALAWISERAAAVKYSHDVIYDWHYGEAGNNYTQYREFQFERDADALEFSLRFG